MKLSERLQAVLGLVQGGTVADIGCDHGKLAKQLLAQGIARKVIACDISAPSLEKAAKLGCHTRLGDGLAPLGIGEADCIVIAGMGGELIGRILQDGREKIGNATLVLQPMQQLTALRKTLRADGFTLTREVLVQEGKRFYVVMCAALRQNNPSAADFLSEADEWRMDNLGLLWAERPPLLAAYLQDCRQQAEHALRCVDGQTQTAQSARRQLAAHIAQWTVHLNAL